MRSTIAIVLCSLATIDFVVILYCNVDTASQHILSYTILQYRTLSYSTSYPPTSRHVDSMICIAPSGIVLYLTNRLLYMVLSSIKEYDTVRTKVENGSTVIKYSNKKYSRLVYSSVLESTAQKLYTLQ